MTARSEPAQRPGIERSVDPGVALADLNRLFDLSLDMLAIVSLNDGRWRRVNPAMSRILGWTAQELLSTPIIALVHPDDQEHSRLGWARLAAGESLIQFEHRLRCRDGTYKWVAWNTAAAPDDRSLYCAGRDVTEVRRVNAALREREERYRSLVQASDTGFCVIEMKVEPGEPLDCRFLEVSEGFERLTTLVDVTGRWMRDLSLHYEESWFEIFGAVALTGRPMHFQHRARELDDRWFDVHAFPVGAPEHRRVGVLFNDVTERRRAEEALASELEAMTRLHELSRHITRCGELRSILEAVLDATITLHGAQFGTIHLCDPATKNLRVVAQRGFDDGFLEQFSEALSGRDSACGIALTSRQRLAIEDVEHVPDFAPGLAAARAAGFRAAQFTPLYTVTGEPLGVLATHFADRRRLAEREHRLTDLYGRQASDAIARHLLEQSLRASEERLRLAVDVGGLATWDWNIETGAVTWSDDHYLLQGYGVGEVTPSYAAWAARVHPDDRDDAAAALVDARDSRSDYARVLRMQHPDGTVKWCSARGRFFYDPTGRAIRMIGVMIDITARREWEERQQLLVAELQHRTRNLIAVVQSLAHQTVAESGSLGVFLQRFDDRLAALSRVQGLLARSDQRRITLGEVLRMEFDALGSDAARERIVLDGPDVVLPDAVVQTLALALHELATNARKYGALAAAGGTLTVNWHIDDGALRLEWLEQGVTPPERPDERAGASGFGRELIERALPYQLHAETCYELGSGGVRCWICLPIHAGVPESRRGP